MRRIEPGISSFRVWSLGPSRNDNGGTLRRRVRETVGLELFAQRRLQDLAGRRMRNTFDESDVVGHPPFGDLAFHEFEDVLARSLLALLELHDQEWPLVPFRMMHADHGSLCHRGMGDCEVLEIDRGNP